MGWIDGDGSSPGADLASSGGHVGGVLRVGPRSRSGTALIGLTVLTALLLLAAAMINVAMVRAARGETSSLAGAPRAQVAIVLGARVYPNGTMSPMLADRVHRAVELYQAGRVAKILVSGDHGDWAYDEPGTMRAAILAAGVPPEDVFTDHAGFDTWATMRRARQVFDVDSAIVVTQRFHLARALYLAHAAGLRATGVSADQQNYGTALPASQRRELIARVKAFVSVTRHAPVLLGPPIPIAGDGRASWGPLPPGSVSLRATRLALP